MIKVLIGDDEWQYARVLKWELAEQPGIEIVGDVFTAEEAVEAVGRVEVDAVLLDVMFKEMGGVEACRQILAKAPDLAVVMVTGHIDEAQWRAAMAAGARGYIVKHHGPDDPVRIASALHNAVRGEQVVDAQLGPALRGLVAAKVDPATQLGLTPREREVLPLVVKGYSNRQIAEELFVQEYTVRNHVSRILAKLNVPNRTAAAEEARRLGIVTRE